LKKWLIFAGKLAVIGLLVWGVRATLEKALEALAEHEWDIHPGWLVSSGALYLLGMVPAALFWSWLLKSCHQEVTVGEAVRTHFLSQLGKYAPGKALVLIIRAGLLRKPGVETTVVTASVFFETFTVMAVACTMAMVILFIWFPTTTVPLPIGGGHTLEIRMSYASVVLWLMMGGPANPKIFRLMAKLLGVNRLNPNAAKKLGDLTFASLTPGWGMLTLGWVLQGLSLGFVLQGLGGGGNLIEDLPLNTAAVCLSVVAGFLTFIPGGLGVRELVLIPLLAPRYGDGTALVSAIILRLVWMAAETLVTVCLYASNARKLVPLLRQWRASRNAPEPLDPVTATEE